MSRLDLSKDNIAAEDIDSPQVADEDFDLVQKLLSNEQKASLHQALRRSKSTPPVDPVQPQQAPLERFFSNASSNFPHEFPMRKADSLENVSRDETNEKDQLVQEVDSLKNEILFFKAQNKELNKSLERSNTLLQEEKKRRMSERSVSGSSLRESMNGELEGQLSLNTIAELTDNERDSSPTSFRSRLSGSFIADDEASQKRKLYGQRKSSISLDEMYDLFGVDKTNDSSKKRVVMMPFEKPEN